MMATPSAQAQRGAGKAPILSYRNVVKRFGNFTALNGVSLDIYPGEVVCFIGPSGSGKSTMLRGTNALDRFDEGDVILDGNPIPTSENEARHLRRRMGMVFQNFELFPHRTAIENVMIGPVTVLGIPKKEAQSSALKLLEKVGLADKTENYPVNLSGGQQQRVAIARALAMEPELLLFDEPTSALDPETIGEVLNVMKVLADEGRTMIVVTHEMSFARRVADWVVVFERGEIVEQGPPEQIFDHPQTERTRSFLSHLGWHG